jgi:hypothetical protein
MLKMPHPPPPPRGFCGKNAKYPVTELVYGQQTEELQLVCRGNFITYRNKCIRYREKHLAQQDVRCLKILVWETKPRIHSETGAPNPQTIFWPIAPARPISPPVSWTAPVCCYICTVCTVYLDRGGIHQHFQVGHNSVITVYDQLSKSKDDNF